MSIVRLFAWYAVAVVALCAGGGLAVVTAQQRTALIAQAALREADAAAALARELAPRLHDAQAARDWLAAAFDPRTQRAVHVWLAGGELLAAHQAAQGSGAAPVWFTRLWPVRTPVARARITDDGRDLGVVVLQLQTDATSELLWLAFLEGLRWAAGLMLAGLGVAATWLLVWSRGLRRVVDQSRVLEEGRWEVGEERGPAELRQLTRGMNATVRRLSSLFSAQAQQVVDLQRRVHLDPVTGLSNRRQFLARLDAVLADPMAPRCAVLIVRLPDLAALNHRVGNDLVDGWLASAAEVMQRYPQRVAAAFVGRLNGVDLALCLPVAGVGEETAASLLAALQATAAGTLGPVEIVIGGIDGVRGVSAGAALAAADAALARAESAGEPVVQRHEDFVADPAGARAWREQITQALAEGRVRLAEYPVLAPSGALLHYECPLQIQLEAGGAYHPARRWLALAARGGLLARVDLAGVELALRAIAGDALPRCVHLAGGTLAAEGVVRELAHLFERAPAAAAALSIEVEAQALARRADAVTALARVLRAHGVQLGIEHAGAAFEGAAIVPGMAVAHVKIEGTLLRGFRDEPAVRDLACGLVTLVHGQGALIIAEGVIDAADLSALWALGFDGATGPAVRLAAGDQATAPV